MYVGMIHTAFHTRPGVSGILTATMERMLDRKLKSFEHLEDNTFLVETV